MVCRVFQQPNPRFSSFQAITVLGSSLFWGDGKPAAFQSTPGAEPLGAKSDELGLLDQIQAILRQDGLKLPGNLCGPWVADRIRFTLW